MFPSPKMNQNHIWVFFISFFVVLHTSNGNEQDAARALVNFFRKLSNNSSLPGPSSGWNLTSEPCRDSWRGIVCDNGTLSVQKISLDGYNLSGIFDAGTLCNVKSIAATLTDISLNYNNLLGQNLEEISNCMQMTDLHISGNQFIGSLPTSLARLNNLKRLHLSNNKFSGSLPDLTRISGLTSFQAQNNHLSGAIPNFDLSNFVGFNISFNNFSGRIPPGGEFFPVSSFLGNPQLCGNPLPNKCASLASSGAEAEQTQEGKPKDAVSKNQILIFSGYFLVGLIILLVFIFKLCQKCKQKEEEIDEAEKVRAIDQCTSKPSFISKDYKTSRSKSEISPALSAESIMVSSSLVVLTSPLENELRFEDLLKAPAELIGRGKHGSVYRVMYEYQGLTLTVKRIKDSTIPISDFKQRMQRLDQVKHPNVLSAVAFYCSRQEKLLVYEYQESGSLFKLLLGIQIGQVVDWSRRVAIAATIAKALAYMHQELREDRIAHGSMKSSNILLNKNMEACISEYGLKTVDSEDQSLVNSFNSEAGLDPFKADIYGFGVILLELLTGKLVQYSRLDLAGWVVSMLREEWTGEVFDKTLIQEGANEERMLNLLQVAIKCVNRSPEARPSISQVAFMINQIKEEEETSMDISEANSTFPLQEFEKSSQ